jgi:hypothetical protein
MERLLRGYSEIFLTQTLRIRMTLYTDYKESAQRHERSMTFPGRVGSDLSSEILRLP